MARLRYKHLLAGYFSVFNRHQHEWEDVQDTRHEEDLGVGMAPAIVVEVKCTQCGAKGIKTIHPMYGTSIKQVPDTESNAHPGSKSDREFTDTGILMSA